MSELILKREQAETNYNQHKQVLLEMLETIEDQLRDEPANIHWGHVGSMYDNRMLVGRVYNSVMGIDEEYQIDKT